MLAADFSVAWGAEQKGVQSDVHILGEELAASKEQILCEDGLLFFTLSVWMSGVPEAPSPPL